MNRREISDHLQKLAFVVELTDSKAFNAKSLSASAWSLRSFDGDLEEAYRSGALGKRRDFSKAVVEVLGELFDHGKVNAFDELSQQIPAGLFDIRRVKGLGPKKVRQLWQELGITSLAELEYACNENRLVELKGFGAKTQDKVKASLSTVRGYLGRLRLDSASEVADQLLDKLDAFSPRVTGALARGEVTVDDIVLTVAAPNPTNVAALFDDTVIEDGTIRVNGLALPVVIHCCKTDAARGWLDLVTTGPQAFADTILAFAKNAGVNDDNNGVAAESDEDVFVALGLIPTPVERRHAETTLMRTGSAQTRLIRLEDLRGSLHNHTTASDGSSDVVTMRDAAGALGHDYIAITEHSVSAGYAGGLSSSELTGQRDEIRGLGNDEVKVLCGVESDILVDGSLDYEDDVLKSLDVVVASVHRRGGLDADAFTERMCAAASHAWTDIIGHPTGRLLLGREPSKYDVEKFLRCCAETGTAVELNSNPARLDFGEEHLVVAKELGVPVSIAADAHSVAALDHLRWGIRVARRAGLTVDDVLNAQPWAEVAAWQAQHRPR